MTIEALTAVAGAPLAAPAPAAARSSEAAQRLDFGAVLDRELGALNARVGTAEQALTDLASGESGNLHRAMLDLEQAKLSFQLAVQVRNKLLEGYQELMRMQI